MPSWTSDLCGCKSVFWIDGENTVGELTTPCSYHSNFNNMLADNRKKNNIINDISELFDMTEKECYFTHIDENGININLYNFSEAELEIIYALNYTNINYNIIESN